MLEDVLEGIGFGGLWRSSTFHQKNVHERQCTALTDRLIEVCRAVSDDVLNVTNYEIAYHCMNILRMDYL